MLSFLKIIFKNISLSQAICAEIEEDIGFFVRNIPGITGFLLRYAAYKTLFGKIASMPYIYPGVRFVFMKNIHLGKGVLINSNTYLYARGGIEIGDNVLISVNCAIDAGHHDISREGLILEKSSKGDRVIIGAGSWVGANVVVLGGVTINDGSIIGAGAVVTKDTEPYSINVGVPARKVGNRRT